MNTLDNHVIIYDEDCPMCHIYTNAFIKAGMLDENGREAYTKLNPNCYQSLDKDRARNEIALVNKDTQEVTYGLNSLFAILGNSFPIFKPLFKFAPFVFLMQHFYGFISYNRKVIAPSAVFEEEGSCIPDMNLSYRWAYIAFAWVVTSFMLVSYTSLLTPINTVFIFGAIAGQIVFQSVVANSLMQGRLIHYLGNLVTVNLIGALLLLPVFLFTAFLTPVICGVYLGIVAAFMTFLHVDRVKKLELHWGISGVWVVYWTFWIMWFLA